MYKQGDYNPSLSTGSTSHVLSVAQGRDQVFRPAPPPSDHLTACLAFLRRVSAVRVTGGDKKYFQICVELHAAVDDPDSNPADFTILRSVKDVELLELEVHGACGHHPTLSPVYNLQPCALCEGVKRLVPLPVKTSHRLVQSTESLHKTLAFGLFRLVEQSLVPPTNVEIYCDGLQRVPSAVTSFLLRGVDQTKL